jgi:hypothetical protein
MIVDRGSFADVLLTNQGASRAEKEILLHNQPSLSHGDESQILEDDEYNQQLPGHWGNPKLDRSEGSQMLYEKTRNLNFEGGPPSDSHVH